MLISLFVSFTYAVIPDIHDTCGKQRLCGALRSLAKRIACSEYEIECKQVNQLEHEQTRNQLFNACITNQFICSLKITQNGLIKELIKVLKFKRAALALELKGQPFLGLTVYYNIRETVEIFTRMNSAYRSVVYQFHS